MTKIVFVGAGSTVFAKNLLADILSFDELKQATICLYDINKERLETSIKVANRVAKVYNATPTIEATMDCATALGGAQFVITMFQIGGYDPCTITDFEIPKKYGLRQTIADSLGIGGIMRALRTVPVLWDLCEKMEKICPNALLINYVNPMAMNMWSINRKYGIANVGLCHSVQWTRWALSLDINVPENDIHYVCAGINHLAFFLEFKRRLPDGTNEDLYPLIRKVIEENRVPDDNRVRYELFKHFGYFVTESSEHFSEYCPWFIKANQPELIEKFNIPLDEYPRRCIAAIKGWNEMRATMEDENKELEIQTSNEYAALIVHSMVTDTKRKINGNVMNNGSLITNLPKECCVEVPCFIDYNGIQPVAVGDLPLQLASLIQTNINVQGLTVEGLVTEKRDYIYQAAMLDPHTAAELNLDQIKNMVDDLLEAHKGWIPEFK
ncbi:MAG: alpha-glucosidase/alpha-galactosidase [Candidatus Sumerlaeales bacterium]|nr:alpha-glucosidase/alpha-galactosidase [Candidatus Sumerlaeales bacterium]